MINTFWLISGGCLSHISIGAKWVLKVRAFCRRVVLIGVIYTTVKNLWDVCNLESVLYLVMLCLTTIEWIFWSWAHLLLFKVFTLVWASLLFKRSLIATRTIIADLPDLCFLFSHCYTHLWLYFFDLSALYLIRMFFNVLLILRMLWLLLDLNTLVAIPALLTLQKSSGTSVTETRPTDCSCCIWPMAAYALIQEGFEIHDRRGVN